jgi:hypothetical protein
MTPSNEAYDGLPRSSWALALHGTVTDATGRPLPGATIAVKGTDRFAVTDEAGGFDLDVAPGARARRRAAGVRDA